MQLIQEADIVLNIQPRQQAIVLERNCNVRGIDKYRRPTFGRLFQPEHDAQKRGFSRPVLADEKGLAAWNGLLLSALAKAHATDSTRGYHAYAKKLADYLAKRLWDGEHLVRALQGDKVLAPASLEDYALVAKGLWDWCR